MSVITDDEAKINELFVRLNNSKPLTGSEVRNAMRGPIPVLIRAISEHDVFRTHVKFSKKRMQEHNVAGKLLLVEHRGKLVDTKKTNLDKFADEAIKAQNTDFQRAADRVQAVLSRMAGIFTQHDTLLSSQGPVTPYYWFVRNADVKEDAATREYLINFERLRHMRTKAGSQENEFEQDLAAYDIMSRSTNDQGSLNGRYSILRRWFERFQLDRANLALSGEGRSLRELSETALKSLAELKEQEVSLRKSSEIVLKDVAELKEQERSLRKLTETVQKATLGRSRLGDETRLKALQRLSQLVDPLGIAPLLEVLTDSANVLKLRLEAVYGLGRYSEDPAFKEYYPEIFSGFREVLSDLNTPRALALETIKSARRFKTEDSDELIPPFNELLPLFERWERGDTPPGPAQG
jgi:hypothetical protein